MQVKESDPDDGAREEGRGQPQPHSPDADPKSESPNPKPNPCSAAVPPNSQFLREANSSEVRSDPAAIRGSKSKSI